MSDAEILCPTCRQPVSWAGNPDRPFCSERCRMVDLGAWAAERYRIPAEEDESEGGEIDPGERSGEGE